MPVVPDIEVKVTPPVNGFAAEPYGGILVSCVTLASSLSPALAPAVSPFFAAASAALAASPIGPVSLRPSTLR